MVTNFQTAVCPRAVDGSSSNTLSFVTRMYSVHRNETIWFHTPHLYIIRATESGFGSPARADRLKIFTPHRKHWPSVAVWLRLGMKGLIYSYTVDRYTTEKDNSDMQHNRAPGPLPDGRAPVICTGFSPSPLSSAVYRGADKSLARPRRKQPTATEAFDFHISYQ